MKEFLTKEIKAEKYILLIISVIACILSVLIFTDVLTVKMKNDMSPDAFAWILLVLGVISMAMSIYNIFTEKKNKKGGK